MPGPNTILKKWWKHILSVVIISVVVVGVLVFLKPVQYLSTTTALPASAYASDKSAIFNENIQALYDALGGADDLDRVLGTADLDTVYAAVADQFNLWDHYKIKGDQDKWRYKATNCLRKNSKVYKTEYGDLKVKVWDTDKNLAPQLANAIMAQLQLIHQNLHSVSNEATLVGLKTGKIKLLAQMDSSVTDHSTAKLRLEEYDKLISQYQLMIDTKPPVLIVVEKAGPSIWPNRPRRKMILAATALLSLIFSLLAVMVIERTKNN